ncbi:5-methyltetrahydropteroyltriglutamate--homocysteine S-methyltransferase [Crossiella sp. SN42]|uniref:5-methyltetrahydropteroyltriglutamate-- homocysteine S-methyltransferase n=1 Tax=Crossiella sp. SN42 TaxID=2944808 RepID=UPI00207C3140|nr:5-methyltetrahydropteroyltriglutamate--homocysteine S-methyltransferase [Crossiella sp. SN42]MCO1574348.1 5-methyltetrahydropteroyltriglutamate--homocysteine S-methyltransferase [Crossiella sp. SN42]
MTSGIGATVLGYPRIGPRRELKRAVERYWAGRIDRDTLLGTAARLRAATWLELREAGLDSVPSNTFSFYDQVLDTAVLVGAVPARYQQDHDLDTYFAAARGTDEVPPLEMTKWFDTNYHYLVPEIDQDTQFWLAGGKPIAEYREAKALEVETRPVLLGPVTFLLLAKGADPLARLDDLLAVYTELLGLLAAEGVTWVQFDEPAFAADRTEAELAALGRAYHRLTAVPDRPKLLVTGYYGALGPALPVLAGTAVEAIAVDLVAGDAEGIAGIPALREKTLVAGVIDGRNVWRADLRQAVATSASLLGAAREVAVSTSSTLLHVPYDLDAETALAPEVRSRLAFARQKVREVVLVGKALREGVHGDRADQPAAEPRRDEAVRARIAALTPADRTRAPYTERAAAQDALLGLPPLATTTIGSFPQTGEIRAARAGLRSGELTEAQYAERMRAEIARVIKLQEEIGLDVMVHGEPERNDMVQYFAEHLDGCAVTDQGWVQSYGSRCVRPPIIHGDVTRPAPITVDWAAYAQSLTGKPVKGMLTGPVTILAWSFVRDDQPLAHTADQVALALRAEIADLEAAGIRIIQVDEPALRELLPLHAADQPEYLDWSVGAFQLAVAGAAPATQIHTHLCYSEFSEVIDAIDGLGADVTTIEAARSKMEVLADLRAAGFSRGVGPGVYDIHSPRVPSEEEVADLVAAAADAVPAKRLWVNPDCGLKTRGYAEVDPALRRMVAAARRVRETLS